MSYLNEGQLNRISELVGQIEQLSDVEKLYLYLQLPCGKTAELNNEVPRLGPACSTVRLQTKQSINGHRSKICEHQLPKQPDEEVTQTYTWILSHLELDANVSLPKQEVYDEYKAFCQANRFEALCVADFGKAMKHAFPCIKPRRLGQRGNSRYCYSGLRKKYKIDMPDLPGTLDEPTLTSTVISTNCDAATRQQSQHGLQTGLSTCGNYDDPKIGCTSSNENYHHQHHHESQQYHHQHQHMHQQQQVYMNTSCVSTDFAISEYQQQQSHHLQQNQTDKQLRPNKHQVASTQLQPHPTPKLISDCGTSTFVNHLQPPGTPDDDDYRHNYMDVMQDVSCNLQPTSLIGASSMNMDPTVEYATHYSSMTTASQHHQQANNNNNNNQHQQQQLHHEQHHHHQHLPQQLQPQQPQQSQHHQHQQLQARHQQQVQSQVAKVIYPNYSTNAADPMLQPNGGTDGHRGAGNNINGAVGRGALVPSRLAQLHLLDQSSYMTSSQFDSCASPFQSPASTPYPMSGVGGSSSSAGSAVNGPATGGHEHIY